jgi:hypothetical protein
MRDLLTPGEGHAWNPCLLRTGRDEIGSGCSFVEKSIIWRSNKTMPGTSISGKILKEAGQVQDRFPFLRWVAGNIWAFPQQLIIVDLA